MLRDLFEEGDRSEGIWIRDIIIRQEQDNQAISTDQLSLLPSLNLRPIDVVVFHGLNGDTLF